MPQKFFRSEIKTDDSEEFVLETKVHTDGSYARTEVDFPGPGLNDVFMGSDIMKFGKGIDLIDGPTIVLVRVLNWNPNKDRISFTCTLNGEEIGKWDELKSVSEEPHITILLNFKSND